MINIISRLFNKKIEIVIMFYVNQLYLDNEGILYSFDKEYHENITFVLFFCLQNNHPVYIQTKS
jgi:hypothetical protein